MDTNLPVLGILILNHNGKEWLAPLYESLRDNEYPNSKIYLVDNGSEDSSVESTLEHYPEVNIICMPENLGYCMAYNLAMPQAFADGCEWVIWANNDIRLEGDCLNELARVARSDSQIGVLGPAFLTWEGDDPNYYMLGNHPQAVAAMRSKRKEPISVEWVEGSFMMVSRRCVEAVGPLDPSLYFYWEDADFCRRARHREFRVVLVPNALARHFAGGWSSGHPENMATTNQLQCRNYYIYKLANPFQYFLLNLVDAFHLLWVNLKNGLPKGLPYLRFQAGVFGAILGDMRAIHKKWIRDRKGGHPPMLGDGFSGAGVRTIGHSRSGVSL